VRDATSLTYETHDVDLLGGRFLPRHLQLEPNEMPAIATEEVRCARLLKLGAMYLEYISSSSTEVGLNALRELTFWLSWHNVY